MAERVDLDAAMERYQTAMWFNAAGPTEMVRTILDSVQDVPALVAELREVRQALHDIGAMAEEARAKLLKQAAGLVEPAEPVHPVWGYDWSEDDDSSGGGGHG